MTDLAVLQKNMLFSFTRTYNVKNVVGDRMHTIITGTNGPMYLGYPPPMFGPWNQPIHPHSVQLGHTIYHIVPLLFGYPPAFPYFGPYVPFRVGTQKLVKGCKYTGLHKKRPY